MMNILGIHNEGGRGKYVGILELFGQKNIEVFQLSLTMSKKEHKAGAKNFSHKEVKIVCLNWQSCNAGLFYDGIPKEIFEEINGILARFQWSHGEERKEMHWFTWNRQSLPKMGGLGFRDLENFNLALFGKQVWRLLQNHECLMTRVLKGRYYGGRNVCNANMDTKASYRWKSVRKNRDLLNKSQIQICYWR